MIMRNSVSPEMLERLIGVVRQHRCVYDPTLPEHKDSSRLAVVWENIANIMGDAEMSGNDWKKKWRTQRDTYTRKKKHACMSNVPLTCAHWRYADSMNFIDPFLPASCISFRCDSMDTIERLEDLPHENSNIKQEHARDADSTDLVSALAPPTLHVAAARLTPGSPVNHVNSAKRAEKRTATNAGLNILNEDGQKKKQSPTPVLLERFPEESFFESYTHRLRNLPSPIKSIVQFQIAQIFFNAENPSLPQQEIMPLSHNSFTE